MHLHTCAVWHALMFSSCVPPLNNISFKVNCQLAPFQFPTPPPSPHHYQATSCNQDMYTHFFFVWIRPGEGRNLSTGTTSSRSADERNPECTFMNTDIGNTMNTDKGGFLHFTTFLLVLVHKASAKSQIGVSLTNLFPKLQNVSTPTYKALPSKHHHQGSLHEQYCSSNIRSVFFFLKYETKCYFNKTLSVGYVGHSWEKANNNPENQQKKKNYKHIWPSWENKNTKSLLMSNLPAKSMLNKHLKILAGNGILSEHHNSITSFS